jgi:hypothetical protein
MGNGEAQRGWTTHVEVEHALTLTLSRGERGPEAQGGVALNVRLSLSGRGVGFVEAEADTLGG